MDERQQEVEDRHLKTLASFVLRARRIEAHSLAADKVKLQKLSSGEITIEVVPSEQKTYLIQELPPEEVIESAAARVRPLIMQDDPTHHSKVMSALGYFTRNSEDEKLRSLVATISAEWRRIKPKGSDILGSSLQMQNAEGVESEILSDMELAFA